MSTYTAAEGGTATVTVTLSADPERTVEVPITTTNQGGASAADYSGVPASVTFNAGETSQPITFAATQDTADDDGESVQLAFGALPTGVTAVSPSETTVSIRDDDDPQVTVSFGAATYTAAEGGTATVTVTLSADPADGRGPDHGHGDGDAERGPHGRRAGRAEGGTATVTVTLSADPERTVHEVPITTTNQGGASAADYSGVPTSVTFDAGDTSRCRPASPSTPGRRRSPSPSRRPRTRRRRRRERAAGLRRAAHRGDRGLSQRDPTTTTRR